MFKYITSSGGENTYSTDQVREKGVQLYLNYEYFNHNQFCQIPTSIC